MKHFFMAVDDATASPHREAENVLISAGLLWTGRLFRTFELPHTVERIIVNSGGFTNARTRENPPSPAAYWRFVRGIMRDHPGRLVAAALMGHLGQAREDTYNHTLLSHRDVPWAPVAYGRPQAALQTSTWHAWKTSSTSVLDGRFGKEYLLFVAGLKGLPTEVVAERLQGVLRTLPFARIHACGLTISQASDRRIWPLIHSADDGGRRVSPESSLPGAPAETFQDSNAYALKVREALACRAAQRDLVQFDTRVFGTVPEDLIWHAQSTESRS